MINNIIDILELANDELKENELFVDIVITGGASLSLLLPSFRDTIDIDVFIKRTNDLYSSISILERYMINDKLKYVAFIPTIDDMTIVDEFKFSNLNAYVISLEDIALMKMFTNRPKDYDDLVNYILPNIHSLSNLIKRCKSYESSYIGNLELTNYITIKNKYQLE